MATPVEASPAAATAAAAGGTVIVNVAPAPSRLHSTRSESGSSASGRRLPAVSPPAPQGAGGVGISLPVAAAVAAGEATEGVGGAGGGLPPLARGWEDLSDESWLNVLSWLEPREIGRLRSVSVRMRALSGMDDLWAELVRRDFRVTSNPGSGIMRALRTLTHTLRGTAADDALRSGGSTREVVVRRGLSGRGTGAAVGGGGSNNNGNSKEVGDASGGSGGGGGGTGAPRTSPFVLYRQLYDEHLRGVQTARETAARRAKERVASIGSRKLRLVCDVLQFPIGIGGIGCAVFATTVMLVLKVTSSPDLPWWAVFLPLYYVCCSPMCCAMLGAWTEARSNAATSTQAWHGVTDGDTHNLVTYASNMRGFYGDVGCRPIRGMLFVINLAMLFALPTVVILKLHTVITASWGVTLIPAWWLLGVSCTLPWSGYMTFLDPNDEETHNVIFPLMLFSVTAPTLATLGVVAAMLDGASIRYAHAMIPLNILAVFEFFGIIFLCVTYLKSSDPEFRNVSAASCCLLTLTFVLSLVAEAGPARSEDRGDGLPADLIVIPIAIGAAVVALLGCALSCFLCRASRQSAFSDLYTFSWCRGADARPPMPAGV